jgi:hypothetical protein
MSDNPWQPRLGEAVWMNYPDSDEPLGIVVGFNPDDAEHRPGQPIIEKPNGDHVNCYVGFLLPFRYGGEEWQLADAEGRVV